MPTQGNQLQLSFGVNAPESRAIHKDATLPDNSPVGVKLDGYADYANLVYKGTTTGGTQSWALTEGSVTLTDTKGTIYAYWPYSSTTSIDAIDVDMTAADQTDWLYATPVTGICEDKAEAAVTMNHAAANINITINKGTYLGSGAISNITVQSDGIALGGTFNAAQATPDYTAFEDEGKPLSRTVSTTTGAANDIMVVPTGASAAITFTATIDGIQFTATSAAVKLEKGNSYVYTLNLSDISTYMTVGSFGVTPWGTKTGGTLELTQKNQLSWETASNGVYAMSKDGLPVMVEDADESCIGVVLIENKHKFMIEKNETNNELWNGKAIFQWNNGTSDTSIKNYVVLDGVNVSGYLGGTLTPQLNKDYRSWEIGALSDFNGVYNSSVIITYDDVNVNMGYLLKEFNATTDNQNQGFTDWYIPALGQLALMYLNITEINAALDKINGSLISYSYWSSSEYDKTYGWYINFSNGYLNKMNKFDYSGSGYRIRFIRNI